MDFLKRHYEKIILIVVLLGLAGAAAWLPLATSRAKEQLSALDVGAVTPKAYKPADLSTNMAAMQKEKTPATFSFSGDHNVFNPVTWKQRYDGEIFVIPTSNDADIVKILKIYPLRMVISFEKILPSGTFHLGVVQEALQKFPVPKTAQYADMNSTNKLFVLREARGSQSETNDLLIELADTREKVLVSKNNPYVRTNGYAADLRYDPESKTMKDVRVNDILTFGGDSYKVIALTRNEVRVLANSNQKPTTIRWTGAP